MAIGVLHRLQGCGLQWQGRLCDSSRALRCAPRLLHTGHHAPECVGGAEVLLDSGLLKAGKLRGVAEGRDPDLLLPGCWLWLPHRLCLLRREERRLCREREEGVDHQLLDVHVCRLGRLPDPGVPGARDARREPLHRGRQPAGPHLHRPLGHGLGLHRLPDRDLPHVRLLLLGLPLLPHAPLPRHRLRVCHDRERDDGHPRLQHGT
mmetsp:Transcript_136806/g.424927  ORF Transcript_136806/g.424927 Transcript_136806/m.424927 type:complete len:206 (+) Transcript_136806:869-1486(+)